MFFNTHEMDLLDKIATFPWFQEMRVTVECEPRVQRSELARGAKPLSFLANRDVFLHTKKGARIQGTCLAVDRTALLLDDGDVDRVYPWNFIAFVELIAE